MVWFFLRNVPAIGTERCGNLLADIANGKQPCCSSNQWPSLYNNPDSQNNQAMPYNLDLLDQDLINPFNFGRFNSTDYTDYSKYAMLQASAYGLDLLSAPLLALRSKLCDTTANNNQAGNVGGQDGASQSGLSQQSAQSQQRVQQQSAQQTQTNTDSITDMWNNVKLGIRNNPQQNSHPHADLANFTSSFDGRINSDQQGNAMFSGGRSRAWCADFVTYCVRKVLGNRLPSGFGSSAVSELRDWGIRNTCYAPTPINRTEASMRNYIKTRVRVGDIMIQKRNGASHTGIVKSVAPDGSSYTVVEGNSSDRVQSVTYRATDGRLSGFVSLSRFA